jgi:hypothetical protein
MAAGPIEPRDRGASTSALRSQVRVEMVLGHPLEIRAIDLPGWVEGDLVEEDDPFGISVANPCSQGRDSVPSAATWVRREASSEARSALSVKG